MNQNLKSQTVNGLKWQLINSVGTTGVQFIVSIVLARLVMPSQFGMIAMLSVFISIAQTVINGGLSDALIRHKERDRVDCSTVFYYNAVVAAIMYIGIYLCAPLISDFYAVAELTTIVRVLAVSLIFGAITNVHCALMSSELNFKTISIVSITSTAIAGAIGIIMAVNGLQVWALVANTLTAIILNSALICIVYPWKPSPVFSIKRLKKSFAFGSKLMASSLLNNIFSQIYSVVIGKIWHSQQLGLYSKADNIATLPVLKPTEIISTVTYSALCKLENDEDKLCKSYRTMLKLSAFTLFPLCLGLGAIAYPLINVLLTNAWVESATILQILVFSLMWYPIHALNLNILKVKGRSDVFFRLEVIKKGVAILMLVVTVPIGITAICYGRIVLSVISFFLHAKYVGKELKIGIVSQLKDILPSFLLASFMFIGGGLMARQTGNDFPGLLIGITTCVAIYSIGTLLFKFSEWQELKHIVQTALRK